MNREAYARLEAAEDRHWWFVGMRAIAGDLLAAAGPAGDVLDAGCGTGGWLAGLDGAAREGRVGSEREGPDGIVRVGLDLMPQALLRARRRGLAALVRGSITDVPLADASFDTVTSLDVVYHAAVGSDRAALAEIHRVLRPGGHLLIQVPALDWLRSRHDREVWTRERYSAAALRARLVEAGFRVRRITYANALLLPAAIAWRLAERALPPGPARDLEIPPAPLDRLGRLALALERRWLARADLPFGLSVIALAQRPASIGPQGGPRAQPD